MTNAPMRTPQTTENSKRRKRWLLLIALLLPVAISCCIVGNILGRRSAPDAGGQITDTIVLSPTDPAHAAALPLSLSGVVHDANGAPYANGKIELHSQPRATDTDKNGAFFFYATELGNHTVYLLDAGGKALASVEVELTGDAANVSLQATDSGGYILRVPADTLLIEVELELSEGSGNVVVHPDSLAVIVHGGVVITPRGRVAVDGNRLVLTPQGAQVFPDGTIGLSAGGVLTNDGVHVAQDGTVTLPDGASVAPDGGTALADGTIIAPGGGITLPEGGSVALGQTDGLPQDVLLSADGTIVLPDGTKIAPNGVVTLPNGTVIGADSSVTMPGGEMLDSENTHVELLDGTKIWLQGGRAELPDGTTAGGNSATLPDGTVIDNQNNIITTPSGAVIGADGSIVLRDGTAVNPAKPGALPGGAVVGADGTVTLPDGTEVKPDSTVVTPGGTQLELPEESGGYVVGDTGYPIGGIDDRPTPGPADPPAPAPDLPAPRYGVTYRWDSTYSFAGLPALPKDMGQYAAGASVTVASGFADVVAAGGTWSFDGWKLNGAAVSGNAGMASGGLTFIGSWTFAEEGTSVTDMVNVTEGGISWTQCTTLNLFATNSSANGKLYPGLSGSYTFSVSNPQSYGIRFCLTLSEAAHAAGAIPFEYRLKPANGSYIDDAWHAAADFSALHADVQAGGSVAYTLEWRWPYESGNDGQDTALGMNAASHTVNITLYAEQVAP